MIHKLFTHPLAILAGGIILALAAILTQNPPPPT